MRGTIGSLAAALGITAFASVAFAQGPTKADSGWVPLFNGTDLSGFNYFLSDQGFVDVKTQTAFKPDSGMIHANGSYSLLTTAKEYSYYRTRLDYRFAPNAGAAANAGLMVVFDNVAAVTHRVGLRPRSIEINFRRDANYPFTMWASQNYGPYITTTVKSGTQLFETAAQGGVPWTCEPWDANKRVVETTVPSPENPPGQWNHGEARMYGDSGAVYLNGVLRTAGWHFQERGSPDDSASSKRVKVSTGGLAIQAEGYELWYKNWEIQELDPVTRVPINARRGCTDKASAKFDARAVVDDGSCSGTGVLARSGLRNSGSPIPGMGTRRGAGPEFAKPDGTEKADASGRRVPVPSLRPE